MNGHSAAELAAIDERIAILRANIRRLVEQGAALSGASQEERNAERIANQTEELDELIKRRDAMTPKIG